MSKLLQQYPNLKAVLILLLALLFFQVSDALSKIITDSMPLEQLSFIRTLCCTLIILTYLALRGKTCDLRSASKGKLLRRGLIFALVSYCYLVVLKHYPLNVMAAAFCGAPLLTTLLSALILKESVKPLQWLATTIGFIGVLMILQPDFDQTQSSLWALLVIPLGYAYLIINGKVLSRSNSSWTINFYSFGCTALVMSYFSYYDWGSLTPLIYGQIFISALCGVIAFGLLLHAFHLGQAALVAPFEYSAVLMALIVDMLLWNFSPNAFTLIGVTLVLCCGGLQIFNSLRQQHKGEK